MKLTVAKTFMVAALTLGTVLPASAQPAAIGTAPQTQTVSAPGNMQATASETSASKDQRRKEWHAKMLSHLTVTLELSPDQAQKMSALMEASMQQRKQRMEEMKAKMKAILTPEQQQKIEAAKQKWEEARKEHTAKAQANATRSGEHKQWHRDHERDHERGHRGHLDLDLTAQQQIQMKALRLQAWHTMKADRENFLAQTSAVLTPLQEASFEKMSHHFSGHREHRGGHWGGHRDDNWHHGDSECKKPAS